MRAKQQTGDALASRERDEAESTRRVEPAAADEAVPEAETDDDADAFTLAPGEESVIDLSKGLANADAGVTDGQAE